MPLPLIPIAVAGIAALGVGAGVKMAGEGAEKAGDGSVKMASSVVIGVAAVAVAFYLLRRVKR